MEEPLKTEVTRWSGVSSLSAMHTVQSSSKKPTPNLSLTPSKRRNVWVCVFVLREQEAFNHREAECSTSLRGIHHYSPVLSAFILNPPSPQPPDAPSSHTYTPSNDFLPVEHATEAKLLFLRIYNPKGSSKKVAERALYKARGSWRLTPGWSVCSLSISSPVFIWVTLSKIIYIYTLDLCGIVFKQHKDDSTSSKLEEYITASAGCMVMT